MSLRYGSATEVLAIIDLDSFCVMPNHAGKALRFYKRGAELHQQLLHQIPYGSGEWGGRLRMLKAKSKMVAS